MRIVKGFPPNYAAIIKAIPAVRFNRYIIFTYGDTVYCPAGNTNLPDHLIAHEEIHARQQEVAGGPDVWWSIYLKDPAFRLKHELQAYQSQYGVLYANHGRQERKQVLSKIAKDLSGPMYGRVIDTKKAKQLITGGLV